MTKTISKKLIVSTLSTVMGVSLVGAITGTVAWYQYSTRSTVSFVGTSIQSSENLQISFNKDSGYKNDLLVQDVNNHLASLGNNADLYPVTTGAIGKDDALPAKFFANPVYQRFEYANWIRADETAYVQFTIYLKLNEVKNDAAPAVVESPRKVYLNDLLIQDDANNQVADISDAIRVHLASDHANLLLGKDDADTDVFGALDINGDGRDDTKETIYDFTDMSQTHVGIYGLDQAKQEKYNPSQVKADVDNNGKLTGEHYLGTLYSKVFDLPQGFNFNGLEYFEENGKDLVPAGEVADGNKIYYVHELVELQGQAGDELPERTIYSANDFDAALSTDTVFVDGHHYYVAKAMDEQPVAGQIMNDGAIYFEDAALQHQVTGVAAAAGTYYVRQDALPVTITIWLEGWQKLANSEPKVLAEGFDLDASAEAGVKYYTDASLKTLATGEVPAGDEAARTYYYNAGDEAMWDAFNYALAKFDVGLMFEVDA